MSWGVALAWKDHFLLHAGQGGKGCFPLELTVTIGAIMLLLEAERLLPKLQHRREDDLVEKLLLVMVIELLDDAVTPRLGRGNEPEMNAIVQAEANQRSHPSWMRGAAVEGHLIVHLKVLWEAPIRSQTA